MIDSRISFFANLRGATVFYNFLKFVFWMLFLSELYKEHAPGPVKTVFRWIFWFVVILLILDNTTLAFVLTLLILAAGAVLIFRFVRHQFLACFLCACWTVSGLWIHHGLSLFISRF